MTRAERIKARLDALNKAFLCAYIECPKHVIDDLKRRFDEYVAALQSIDLETHECPNCHGKGLNNWRIVDAAAVRWACCACGDYMVIVEQMGQ